jgi:hypothetical protein
MAEAKKKVVKEKADKPVAVVYESHNDYDPA